MLCSVFYSEDQGVMRTIPQIIQVIIAGVLQGAGNGRHESWWIKNFINLLI